MVVPGPLSVTIQNCNTVSVEGLAFSWLLSMDVANVRELFLGGGSFSLEPTAANVGENGPGMSVGIHNLLHFNIHANHRYALLLKRLINDFK